MAVSDTKLRSAKPKSERYRITLGGNVYLEIMTTGKKVWRMRFKNPNNGKPAIYTFGDYPKIGILAVQNLAEEVKSLVEQGIHPIEHREQEKAKAKALAAIEGRTFESVARQWHRDRLKAKKWKESHGQKIIKSLENDIFPKIGNMPMVEIDAPILLELMESILSRGVIETARKLSQRVNAVFRYAIVRKIIKTNPAELITDELPVAEVSHNPHLTPEQIPAFLDAIENSQARESVKLAILITMHTLVRTSETRFATWDEFDIESKVWSIPGERMKAGRPHIIPLSSQVLGYLERLKKVTKSERYLFTTNTTRKPMSENAMLNVLYKAGYKGIVTIHGLRGTASTILNEQDFRHDIVESALAHVDPDKVRGAYNHAAYLAERAPMMQHYSDYLDSLRSGSNVVAIRSNQA